jgi:hypothetical protein
MNDFICWLNMRARNSSLTFAYGPDLSRYEFIQQTGDLVSNASNLVCPSLVHFSI